MKSVIFIWWLQLNFSSTSFFSNSNSIATDFGEMISKIYHVKLRMCDFTKRMWLHKDNKSIWSRPRLCTRINPASCLNIKKLKHYFEFFFRRNYYLPTEYYRTMMPFYYSSSEIRAWVSPFLQFIRSEIRYSGILFLCLHIRSFIKSSCTSSFHVDCS